MQYFVVKTVVFVYNKSKHFNQNILLKLLHKVIVSIQLTCDDALYLVLPGDDQVHNSVRE